MTTASGEDMETITLSAGSVRYRVEGEESELPPVVFVHGFLVNGSLWEKAAQALAARGVRSYAPDWPLGAHSVGLRDDADRSPAAVARLILEFIEALDLRDVTVVGNDTGGALTQMLAADQPDRVARVVLTPCDTFDNFLAPPNDVGVKYDVSALKAATGITFAKEAVAFHGYTFNSLAQIESTLQSVETATQLADARRLTDDHAEALGLVPGDPVLGSRAGAARIPQGEDFAQAGPAIAAEAR